MFCTSNSFKWNTFYAKLHRVCHTRVSPHTVRMRNMPSSLDKCLHAQGTQVAPGMAVKHMSKWLIAHQSFIWTFLCSPIFPHSATARNFRQAFYEEKLPAMGKAKARGTQWPIDWHLARAPARGLLAPFAAPAWIGFLGTCNNLILPGEK